MKEADYIIANHWDKTIPVDLHQICESVEVKIIEVESAEWCSKIENKTIYYNSSESVIRQRFAIAHALGHIMLGHNVNVDYPGSYDSDISNRYDQQANAFAMRILIPDQILKYCIENKLNFRQIVKIANVSEVATAIRIKQYISKPVKWFF